MKNADGSYVEYSVISYFWGERLFDLIKDIVELGGGNRCNEYIWVDIISIDQNDPEKSKDLSDIADIYANGSKYYISSEEAFKRYWCCYELSIPKKSIDLVILSEYSREATGDGLFYLDSNQRDVTSSVKDKKWNEYCQRSNELINFNELNVIKNNILELKSKFENNPEILIKNVQQLIDSCIKDESLDKYFDLKNAKISFDSDKIFINKSIINIYGDMAIFNKVVRMHIVKAFTDRMKDNGRPLKDKLKYLIDFYTHSVIVKKENREIELISKLNRVLSNL